MKTSGIFKTGLFLAGLTLVLATGCKKDDDNKDADTGSAEDNAFAQSIFDDVKNMSDQAAAYGDLATYRNGTPEQTLLSQCATVTLDTTTTPRLITIDFGTTNCMCLDGRNRRGKIFVTYAGAYRDSGSVHAISFNNYYVNDYKVAGPKSVTNMGTNTSGNKWFNISISNGMITAPNGLIMTYTSTRQREWVAGESTLLNWLDDVYHISGSAAGSSFAGVTFTATITDPLVVALNCWWIKDGVLEFSPTGVQTRVIDYGYQNGACDNKAEVTIGSNTYIVNLR
jgi:hypothetical protein